MRYFIFIMLLFSAIQNYRIFTNNINSKSKKQLTAWLFAGLIIALIQQIILMNQ